MFPSCVKNPIRFKFKLVSCILVSFISGVAAVVGLLLTKDEVGFKSKQTSFFMLIARLLEDNSCFISTFFV